jgi:hypothetical protein
MILKEMLFGEQAGAREKELRKKEKREPFGFAQGKQAPALQNAVIYEYKYITNYRIVKAILSFSYLVGLERVRGESGNGMEITLERMGRSLWHRR